MRINILRIAALALIGSYAAPAQVGSTPAGELQRRRVEADVQRRMSDLHTLEQRLRIANRKRPEFRSEPRLSKEERERILTLRRIDSSVLDQYSTFLKQPKAGVFKLFPDLGCITRNVVRISSDCDKFVPVSSSFTFRTNAYGDDIYHDIHFEKDRISSNSFFSQGILTALGDVPIEDIDLAHPALRYLAQLATASDLKIATDHAKQFENGVDASGFRFADSVLPNTNTTYAIRMIAYRLDNSLAPVTEETSLTEMLFHSLAFDKRVDVLAVFRIVDKEEHGGLTVVWKELERKEAPKLKFKNKNFRDFRMRKRPEK